MLTQTAPGTSRLSFWPRVREFAVPPTMIETATARRHVGDWAGACAAAHVDVDLHLRAVARTHGQDLMARLRADLRHLAPDLPRWHLPRVAPDGLLRPGLTIALAPYEAMGRDAAGQGTAHAVQLAVRTPPAWADAGQRISLALWDGSPAEAEARRHPHARPSRRFRLDLHRHVWDARRSDELRSRSSGAADQLPAHGHPLAASDSPTDAPDALRTVPQWQRCAVDRWAAEADMLLRAAGRPAGPVAVRLGARHRLILEPVADEPTRPRITAAPRGRDSTLPVLPAAATWALPDLELLRAGAIEVDQLHPLAASALAPGSAPAGPPTTTGGAGQPRLVQCRGAQHRIGLVDGVLTPLDHDPAEIRREELLVALTGTPLPCLRTPSPPTPACPPPCPQTRPDRINSTWPTPC
ncbi:hypothetical protein AB0B50_28430 [Streptomyces sp. NPDC041068]|uniref:hypothetical protein n=1 Tax=Streptomyces sp. NPDC041068 TaxID=3155130 RepID=UPI0033E58FCF